MIIEDKGVVLSIRVLQESGSLVRCITSNNGIVAGFSRLSRKSFITPGNIVAIHLKSKSDQHLGFLKIELIKNIIAIICFEKLKIFILNSAIELISIMCYEMDHNSNIFEALYNLIAQLHYDKSDDELIAVYLFFEITLLEEVGFGLQYSVKHLERSKVIEALNNGLETATISLNINKAFIAREKLMCYIACLVLCQ